MKESKETVEVRLPERGYAIEIGRGTLAEAGRFLRGIAGDGARHVVLITDANVEPLHAPTVVESLAAAGCRVDRVAIRPGEESKCVATAEFLWQKLLELGADRQTVVAALGGGVVGDLAGFAAATFARGIGLLQIPTTLLAQVDSAIGGKVGINLPGAKNIVGAFWQPLGVLVDLAALDTLPQREFVAGLAEVAKIAVALDADFFAYLEASAAALVARDPGVVREVVIRCCRLKAAIVERDERETGTAASAGRAALNYGHTFGHALETVTGYRRWLHGEAVSIGMMCAARLAERLGRVGPDFVRRQRELLVALGLPVELPDLDADALLAAMARDKKSRRGQLRFVLPSGLGHVELAEDVSADDILAAMRS